MKGLQGSIDGSLIVNFFMNDLFLFFCLSALSNSADVNNLFTTGTHIQLINEMEKDFRTVNNWFYENFLILNLEKHHFMSNGKGTDGEDVFTKMFLCF